jgi:DNA-binding CsgD family transcriptional regulator
MGERHRIEGRDPRMLDARALAELARTPGRPAALSAYDELLPAATVDLADLIDTGRAHEGLRLARDLTPAWLALRFDDADLHALGRLLDIARADPRLQGPDLGEVLVASELLACRWQGRFDPAAATARIAAGLRLVRGAGRAAVVRTLDHASQALMLIGDLEHAGLTLREGAILTRGTDERLPFLGWASALAHQRGDLTAAASLAAGAHRLATESEDVAWTVRCALIVAPIARHHVSSTVPRPPPHEILELSRASKDPYLIGRVLVMTSLHALARGGPDAAAHRCGEALRWSLQLRAPTLMTSALMVLVHLAARSEEPVLGARAHGAVTAQMQAVRHGMAPEHHAAYERVVEGIRSDLGSDAFDREVARGRRAPLRTAVLDGIAGLEPLARGCTTDDVPAQVATLTTRETEVIRALATGRRNREIAELLGLTTKTVMHHCTHIFRKIGVHSRGAAVAWAYEHGVIGARPTMTATPTTR